MDAGNPYSFMPTKMKKLFFLAALGVFASFSSHAQASSQYNAQSNPSAAPANGSLWTPPATICDPYIAEKKAEASMKPVVKGLYNAAQTPEDKNINAARNVICNPPIKSATRAQ